VCQLPRPGRARAGKARPGVRDVPRRDSQRGREGSRDVQRLSSQRRASSAGATAGLRDLPPAAGEVGTARPRRVRELPRAARRHANEDVRELSRGSRRRPRQAGLRELPSRARPEGRRRAAGVRFVSSRGEATGAPFEQGPPDVRELPRRSRDRRAQRSRELPRLSSEPAEPRAGRANVCGMPSLRRRQIART
jgi:hypothetical protein